MSTPATAEELRARAYVAVRDHGWPITAVEVAKRAQLTTGGALGLLHELVALGHLSLGPKVRLPAPALDAFTLANFTHTRRSVMPTTAALTLNPDGDGPPLLAAALAYAERGWHVFPLRPGDKRPAFPDHSEDRCTGRDPRCRAAGHHQGWEARATTDPGRIERAWTHGRYGIGIACGPSRLVVIDLDAPKLMQDRPGEWARPGINDGADVLAELAREAGHPAPWDTHTVITGRGGMHLYFTAPTLPSAPDLPAGGELRNTAGTLGWLIDTRAAGGYVVAPPTVVEGRAYVTAAGQNPGPLPEWLTTRLTPAPTPSQRPVTVPLRATGDARRDAYLTAALTRQSEAVTTAVEGGRNHALYLSAVSLGQLVAGGALAADVVTAALTAAAHTAGLDATETARTITSGLRAGAKRPRSIDAREAA